MNNLREIKKVEVIEKNLKQNWENDFPYMFRSCINEFIKVLESHFNNDCLINMYKLYILLVTPIIRSVEPVRSRPPEYRRTAIRRQPKVPHL